MSLLLLGKKSNATKILRTRPADLLAFWPGWEAAGTAVAADISGNGLDGAYANVTLGQPGVDNRTCMQFNGTNSRLDIYSAGFETGLIGAEFTFACWFRVANAGVWTDGTDRYMLRILRDGDNLFALYKRTLNNRIDNLYIAGAVGDTVAMTPISPTAWFHFAVTASAAGDALIGYINAVVTGVPQAGLGVWAPGSLNVGQTNVGCIAAGGSVWDGWIQYPAIWNAALTQPELAGLVR